jgi:hypothetical protein
VAALKRDATRQDELRDVLEQQLNAAAAAAAAASGRESALVSQLQAAKQQAETAAQQHSQRVCACSLVHRPRTQSPTARRPNQKQSTVWKL